MDVAELLVEIYDRVPPLAAAAVEGLDAESLAQPPPGGNNPIGWLVWHIARVADHQLSPHMGVEQVWTSGDWAAGFGLAPDPDDLGYGHTPEDVASVRPRDGAALLDYLTAVFDRNRPWLASLTETDLDRVIDTAWDPPVTLGVRLVSVADDCLQHAGQAAYARGQGPLR